MTEEIEYQAAQELANIMLRAAMTADYFQVLMVRLQVGRAS